ncbi:MAG TPA: tetratricopeptide repeat protein [Gemmatimonadaceae bacterium]|nr:tetratricopeptide repeat protein [Gemmatimonadaceae bacterium]
MEPVSLWLMTAVAGKVLDSMLGDRANRLIAAVVGGVIGNRADRLVCEAAGSSWNFFKNLRTQDPNLNHDLERATREAYLLATLELIRQAELRTEIDSSRFLTAGNAEALATIRRAIEADLRNIDNTLPQPLTDAHLFLIDPDAAPAERLGRLRDTLRRNLTQDFSRWLPDGQEPTVVNTLLRDGWLISTARVGNVARDWYSLIAIAFIEKVKTNPRLSTVFESKLLAQIASREPAAAPVASFQGLAANLEAITVPLQRIEDALGLILRDSGDLAGARARFARSLEIAERLAQANPTSAAAQRDVGLSQDKLGDVLRDAGDLAGARARFARSLEIAERLAEADPTSAAAQRDVSLSLHKLGDVLRDTGDLAGARARFARSLEIFERLAEAVPTSAAAQRDVSVSQNKLGDVLRDSGDLAGARAKFAGSLEIPERLAEADPTSAAAQRAVSVSLHNLGDVLRDTGDLAGACRSGNV